MKLKQKLLDYFVYVRHGHSTFPAFVMSLWNFVVIQYALLIENVPALTRLFPTLTSFALSLLIVYLPLTILLGWWDYRRGSVASAERVRYQANPWVSDVSRALMLLAQGKNEEAIEILRKWTNAD